VTIKTRELVREIRRRNPRATQEEIAQLLGITRQIVKQALSAKCAPSPPLRDETSEERYQNSVLYAQKVIRDRGHIWEGARPAFESGDYNDPILARMLAEGVIIPAGNPNRGYILPAQKDKPHA